MERWTGGRHQEEVLPDGHPFKDPRELEGSPDPQSRQAVRRIPGYLFTLEEDVSCRGLQIAADQIKERCLPGSVGSNQSGYASPPDAKRAPLNGRQSSEFLGQVSDRQNRIVHFNHFRLQASVRPVRPSTRDGLLPSAFFVYENIPGFLRA